MLDPAIEEFFKVRKDAWLKKKTKSGMTEEEMKDLQQERDEVFALENWLPNAAKRAGQISLSTHPCTFSHPSARKNKNGSTSPVFIKAKFTANGFLSSGNVQVEADALGNAAALDVYKFLTLVMQDGELLLHHIQNKTELADQLFAESHEDPVTLREGFLAMATSTGETVTSSKIKQVYFPISTEVKEYHLLSILTHSGHLFELRKRLDDLRFSDETKSIRDLRKNNQFSDSGYQEIYDLTTIGYGGTKPQNISVLNNQYAGKAHLLSSIPPELTPREVRLPNRNFFGDVVYPKQIKELFEAFHRLLNTDYNNVKIREGIEYRVQGFVDHVVLKMWQVRKALSAQEHSRPDSIPEYQKIWLFPERAQERLESEGWLMELVSEVTRYFMASYKRSVSGSIALEDAEYLAFLKIIERNKEAFL